MEFIEGEVYHIYNRGNKGQKIFFTEENYLFFLRKVRKELLPYCEILAYCLMPNHFHLMVKVKTLDTSGSTGSSVSELKTKTTLNNGIAILLRSYTRAIQTREGFSGSLFQQKTKARALNNQTGYGLNHPAICFHYIHQNPLRAELVAQMQDWEFSSFKDYAGLRNGTLCNRAAGLSATGIREENFVQESHEVMVDIQE